MIFKGQLSYMIPGNFISWSVHNLPEGLKEKNVAIPRDYNVKGAEKVVTEIGVKIEGLHGIYFPEVIGGERLKTAVFEIEKVDRKNFKVLKYLGDVERITEVKFTPKVSGKKPSVSRTPIIPLKKEKSISKISSEKIKFTVYSDGKMFRTITRRLLPGNKVKWRGKIYAIRPNPFKESKIKYIIFAD